ncbi:Metallo-hydrolase/oxidoreductase [Hypoxylon crocopeplum]|nr:Metallo-hydrolase/oxidoreductase [Hypoxylon crocopeplum]
MSTFDGIVHEFPDIRIDFFRGFDRRPPLACFLSHVHSDHLAGLDKLRSPFVYCSAATREILLRLEKYPCRLNYAKGIFEDPRMQTYKHLAKVLKPIPLDTPTEVELEPGKNIQVTLLDANHCAGAVMFLIEGNSKAVLYTGDIRSEPWWVNTIARNPSIIEYSTGLKILDRIYLDTSMLGDFPLQTKAKGLRELLEKVAQYPEDTIFYMQAWTYGYEEVWVALSKALNSKVHVDKYKMGVYKSLATKSSDSRFAAQTHLTKDAPYLVGFTCGNNQHEGCLTLDEDVRIHSCEKGTACTTIETKPIVWIKPIVAHLKNGRDMIEVGIGGGGDDLAQKPSLEAEDILALMEIITNNEQLLGELGHGIKDILRKALVGSRDIGLDIEMSKFTEEESIAEILKSLAKKVKAIRNPTKKLEEGDSGDVLPNRIVFPYARHSSLPELRHLVKTFKPKDIWPCTVDPLSWEETGITMQGLFGDCCTGKVFEHDLLIERLLDARRELQEKDEQGQHGSQYSTESNPGVPSSPVIPSTDIPEFDERDGTHSTPTMEVPTIVGQGRQSNPATPSQHHNLQAVQAGDEFISSPLLPQKKRDYDSFQESRDTNAELDSDEDVPSLQDSQASTISDHAYETRLRAFRVAQANMEGNGTWDVISLISTTDHHSTVEPELGGS